MSGRPIAEYEAGLAIASNAAQPDSFPGAKRIYTETEFVRVYAAPVRPFADYSDAAT